MKRIGAIVPYAGAKRKMAARIVAELGKHTSYWELCCASLAVLLEKERARMEVVCDLHGDVTNLARVLASPDALRLFERLSRTLFSDVILFEAAEALRDQTLGGLDRAYFFFVKSWMGRNGFTGTKNDNASLAVRYTSNGGDPALRFKNAVAAIPSWVERLTGVTILTTDIFDVIPRIEDKPGVAIYADPPYVAKNFKYLHDFAEGDHKRLADLFRQFKHARIVVSYYDHPTVRALYEGWTFKACPTPKSIANQGKRDQTGGEEAPEVLIINGACLVAA